MGKLEEDKIIQKLDEDLSEGLELLPKYIYNYFTNNTVQRVISYLMGWRVTDGKPIKLSVTNDGLLRVSATSSVYSINETKSGNAPDNYGAEIAFSDIVSQVDIMIWDNPVLIQRTVDGVVWQDAIEIPANTSYSFTASTHGFRIKNKTAGQTARYQVIGWR